MFTLLLVLNALEGMPENELVVYETVIVCAPSYASVTLNVAVPVADVLFIVAVSPRVQDIDSDLAVPYSNKICEP